MRYSLRPLTNSMIRQLKIAREKITTGEAHVPISHFKHTLQSLHRRGFIEIKSTFIDGKQVMCVVITDEGNSFLDHYSVN